MDISLLYPIASDFSDSSERANPEVFNYFCLSGKQVFLRISRKRYEVLTGLWYPYGYELKDYISPSRRYLIFQSTSFDSAHSYFLKLCRELLMMNQGELF